jgi:hypothetical protein
MSSRTTITIGGPTFVSIQLFTNSEGYCTPPFAAELCAPVMSSSANRFRHCLDHYHCFGV